ncbi:MAG: BMP family ABC transporter substrate-binding protein [Solirubrobacterales bacterium]|nr:BMP family ABC transporter substrate-binding protein [Solirubrobacterales bacterium]
MQINSKRLAGVLAAVVVAVVVAACGSSSKSNTSTHSGSSSASGGTIAIATPAKTADYGWNAQGYAGAKAAASANGMHVKLVQNIGYNNTDTILRQLALAKPTLIIAHASGFDTSAQRIAVQYRVPTITYDIPTMLHPGSLSNITTSSQQGAYLAGILAAHMTKTNKVGVIISASDTNWYEMTGGFAAGAHSVKPHLPIVFGQIGPASYDDSAGGKRVAASVIASGADVIFTMGDNASFGYLQAIGTAHPGHKLWMIGDIGDMTPIDTGHVFLSSVLWNFTHAYNQALSDIKSHTFGNHNYNLTLANGGISLLKTKYIPASVWLKIETAQKGIESGAIKVPDTTTAAKAKAVLNGS